MFKRPRSPLDVILLDICYEEVSLNTRLSEFLTKVYAGDPPTLTDLSRFHNAYLYEVFDTINITLDETKLPYGVVNSERYKVLKAFSGDRHILRDNEVHSISDWTAEKRLAVMSLTKADQTPLVSRFTINMMDRGKKQRDIDDDKRQSVRKGVLSRSYVGENNYLGHVAVPVVDRILEVMERKIMESNTTEEHKVTSYMNTPVPSAYVRMNPAIMVTTKADMHFVSVEVKADSSQLALAFDEALKAGFFLTQLTGYSAIIMAVNCTEVLMGLHTLLTPPEETHSAASRGTGVWLQSARDPLPAMDKKLLDDLSSLPIADRKKKVSMLSKYKSVVYPCAFDLNLIQDRSTFEAVFTQYLEFLVDPICFGILSDAASEAVLEKSNKDCHVVMCDKPLADKCRLPGCPDQFVAKLDAVQDLMLLQNVHTIFGCEIYGHAYHEFTITTKATCEITPSPSETRNTAVSAAPKPPAKRTSAKPAKQQPSTSTAGAEGVTGSKLITYIYRKFEGSPLDSKPSIAQFVQLMGDLIALHDKEGVYHCDLRRPNIIVKGDSLLQIIDYEYCLKKEYITNTNKVPIQLQSIRTAKFFSEMILKNNIKGACSFTGQRYVQLLDICSLFYFVGGVQVPHSLAEGIFSDKFNEQFCAFIAREKKLKRTSLRTTSEILQDIFQQTPSLETPDWRAVMDEAKRRNWLL